jgi:putative component of toxin-antitoxin plasmid stabilization module
MDQDLLLYVSSQMTCDAIMKVEMNNRWPKEPRAVGKSALRHWRRTRGIDVMKFGPVKGVSDGKRELSLRMGRGGRVFRTTEKMSDESSAKSCNILVAMLQEDEKANVAD